MVVSAVSQPRDTYLLWKRFSYPGENGPISAFAVPTWVANQLNSAYSVMLTMLLGQVWTVIIALVLYYLLRWRKKHKATANQFHPLVPILWNNRSELIGSFMETFKYTKDDAKKVRLWMVGILFLVFSAWVGQTAISIIVPPMVILNNTAPVDPKAVYIPTEENLSNSQTAAVFVLEAPSSLRAVGSTGFAKEIVDQRVMVTPPETLGKTSKDESILRINYGYNVTGVDFGLQKYPELTLNVNGSCVTEYGWFVLSSVDNVTESSVTTPIVVDWYKVFQFTQSVSLFDARQPIAYFLPGNSSIEGALGKSNATWAAVISSTGRDSFTEGTDPWYLTEQLSNTKTGTTYQVLSARPVLSCWEDNVWSYKGHNSTLTGLNSTVLPGLGLSIGMQIIFAARLNRPMIYTVGSHLGLSALVSTSTAVNQIFDAGASSIQNDLTRLVQAAFVATSNILTDTTLFPANSDLQLPNWLEGVDGIGDFVVWSPDASALSMKVLIAIPSLLVGVWLLATVLLLFTPVRVINALDPATMFTFIKEKHPTFGPAHDKETGAVWQESSEKADPKPTTDLDLEQGSPLPENGKKGAGQVTEELLPSVD